MPLLIPQGTLVSAPITVGNITDVYPTHLSNLGKGGLQTFLDVSERDAIRTERRENLMEVNILNAGTLEKYTLVIPDWSTLTEVEKLTELADNTNWVKFTGGGGGGTSSLVLNDAVSNTTDVWSSSKIASELNKSFIQVTNFAELKAQLELDEVSKFITIGALIDWENTSINIKGFNYILGAQFLDTSGGPARCIRVPSGVDITIDATGPNDIQYYGTLIANDSFSVLGTYSKIQIQRLTDASGGAGVTITNPGDLDRIDVEETIGQVSLVGINLKKWATYSVDPSIGTPAWAQYADTQYTDVSRFTIANTTTSAVPNNSGSEITSFMPAGLSFYDGAKVTPGGVGEIYILRVNFKASSSALNNFLNLTLDIGGTQGIVLEKNLTFPRGANETHSFSSSNLLFSLGTFISNGGIVSLYADSSTEIWDVSYVIARVSANDLDLQDAPSDGSSYVRKDGAWVVAEVITSSNGITKVGSDITLGGTLTADTVVDTNGNKIDIGGVNAKVSIDDSGGITALTSTLYSNIVASVYYASSGSSNFQMLDNGNTTLLANGFIVTATSANILMTASGGNLIVQSQEIILQGSNRAYIQCGGNNIEILASSMVVTDAINGKGLEYAGDYSANFTANSLVTKDYVDNNAPASGAIIGVSTLAELQTALSLSGAGNEAKYILLKKPIFVPNATTLTVVGQCEIWGTDHRYNSFYPSMLQLGGDITVDSTAGALVVLCSVYLDASLTWTNNGVDTKVKNLIPSISCTLTIGSGIVKYELLDTEFYTVTLVEAGGNWIKEFWHNTINPLIEYGTEYTASFTTPVNSNGKEYTYNSVTDGIATIPSDICQIGESVLFRLTNSGTLSFTNGAGVDPIVTTLIFTKLEVLNDECMIKRLPDNGGNQVYKLV